MTRFKGDDNYKAGGIVGGYSSADDDNAAAPTLIPLRVDPVTKRLLVDATVSGDGIADGDAVDVATLGFLFLGSDGSNYQAVVTDATGHLQVDVLSGGGGGTLVKDNAAVDADNTGQIILGTDGSNYQVVATDATGHLQVDVLSGGGGGTLVKDNEAVDLVNDTGVLILGHDGSNYQILSTDSSGNLQVDIVSGAGGVQYTEGDTDATITGTAILWEDAANTLVAVSATKQLPVLADLGVTDNAVLDAIATSLAIMDDWDSPADHVNIRHLNATDDLVTVTSITNAITVNAHAVTNAGTFAVQVDGTALTALQLIDDVVYVDDTATHATGTSKGVGIMAAATPTDAAIDANDIGMVAMSLDRKLYTQAYVASGGIASGAIASGAVASGAIASGAIASGAAVSGSFADGAIVTLGAKADAKSTATDTTAITAMQVLKQISASVQAPPSQAVTNAGTFAVQVDGTALTALQLIDDVVLAEDAAHSSGDKGVMALAIRDDTLDARSGAENDYEPLHTNANGALWVIDVNSASALTALQLIDNLAVAVDGNYINVNNNIAGTDILGGAGAVAAGVQRVTLASDDPAVTALQLIDNAISGAGFNITQLAGAGVPIGAGVEATALRVTLATDSTGVVSIDDNGGAITVDGTVAVTNADLSSIKTAVEVIDNMISGSEAQVDVITLPAIPAGTNAIGKILPTDIDVTAHTNYARKYYTSAGAATDGIIWSPAAGKRWHVTSLIFQTSADATITFEDDKSGGDDPVLKGEFKAGSGLALTFDERYPFASGEDAADLTVTTSAGNIYITVVGYEI